jgi:DNA-binding MurR/RpiR family transcriptional regulator
MTKKRIGRADIVECVMDADIAKLRYTMDTLDRAAFNHAVDALLAAKRIYVAGARSSEPIARILFYNLSLIFDNVRFVNPTYSSEIYEQMFSIGENDTLIAFSFPRYSAKMVNSVKFASDSKAKVVAITDSKSAPIAEYANYVLTAQSDMASFMDSLVAPLSIINAMIVEITRRREREIKKRFDMLEKIWEDYGVYNVHTASHKKRGL